MCMHIPSEYSPIWVHGLVGQNRRFQAFQFQVLCVFVLRVCVLCVRVLLAFGSALRIGRFNSACVLCVFAFWVFRFEFWPLFGPMWTRQDICSARACGHMQCSGLTYFPKACVGIYFRHLDICNLAGWPIAQLWFKLLVDGATSPTKGQETSESLAVNFVTWVLCVSKHR